MTDTTKPNAADLPFPDPFEALKAFMNKSASASSGQGAPPAMMNPFTADECSPIPNSALPFPGGLPFQPGMQGVNAYLQPITIQHMIIPVMVLQPATVPVQYAPSGGAGAGQPVFYVAYPSNIVNQ